MVGVGGRTLDERGVDERAEMGEREVRGRVRWGQRPGRRWASRFIGAESTASMDGIKECRVSSVKCQVSESGSQWSRKRQGQMSGRDGFGTGVYGLMPASGRPTALLIPPLDLVGGGSANTTGVSY